MSSCWEKFLWVGAGGDMVGGMAEESLQVLWTLDFVLWTWTWIVTIFNITTLNWCMVPGRKVVLSAMNTWCTLICDLHNPLIDVSSLNISPTSCSCFLSYHDDQLPLMISETSSSKLFTYFEPVVPATCSTNIVELRWRMQTIDSTFKADWPGAGTCYTVNSFMLMFPLVYNKIIRCIITRLHVSGVK